MFAELDLDLIPQSVAPKPSVKTEVWTEEIGWLSYSIEEVDKVFQTRAVEAAYAVLVPSAFIELSKCELKLV
jgi:hypothetical protein